MAELTLIRARALYASPERAWDTFMHSTRSSAIYLAPAAFGPFVLIAPLCKCVKSR